MTVRALQRRGIAVQHCATLAAVQQYCCTDFSHAVLDMKLSDGHALDLIADLCALQPAIKVVLLTGYASIATAVQAIKRGAYNYLAKPATLNEILAAFEITLSLPVPEQPLSLKRLEWEKIQQTLTENQGNVSLTAKQLNLHRRTLQRKLRKRPVQR